MTDYSVGTVQEIISEKRILQDDRNFYSQTLKVKRQDTDEVIELQAGSEFQPLNEQQRLTKGRKVIMAYQEVQPGQMQYVLTDVYRLPVLGWLAVGFFALVILISRKQGFLAIVGMILSLGVLTYQVIPQILAGQNPILVSLIGCSIVAVLTVYLSHGFTKESNISLISMLLTLLAVSALSWFAVRAAHLTGLGSEEAYYLQFGPTTKINLQGLLLAGIMLGTLGVLDDIAIAQVSVVTQLKQAKPHIEFAELYTRSLVIGKDHVASLVNTLILAYAGSSLPLFLLFTVSQVQPIWVALNSEMIAEEIMRTLIGSMGLVLAVPLTTLAAAAFALYEKGESKKEKATNRTPTEFTPTHGHHH